MSLVSGLLVAGVSSGEVGKAVERKQGQKTMQAEQGAANVSQIQKKKIVRFPDEKLTSFDASRVMSIWKLVMETASCKQSVTQMTPLQFKSPWILMKFGRGESREFKEFIQVVNNRYTDDQVMVEGKVVLTGAGTSEWQREPVKHAKTWGSSIGEMGKALAMSYDYDDLDNRWEGWCDGGSHGCGEWCDHGDCYSGMDTLDYDFQDMWSM